MTGLPHSFQHPGAPPARPELPDGAPVPEVPPEGELPLVGVPAWAPFAAVLGAFVGVLVAGIVVGVAIGTLVPIAASAIFIIFPAACRRVQLPVTRALAHAIWPAAWPAVAVGLVLAFVQRLMGATLGLALVEAAAAGLLYVGLFIIAVGRRDRAIYTARIWELAT